MNEPRRFRLIRREDVSGVSGTGHVADGVLFPDGHAAIHWTGHTWPTTTPHPGGIPSVLGVHGHDGRTTVEWIDAEPTAAHPVPEPPAHHEPAAPVFVAMIGELPTVVAATLEAAQRHALDGESKFQTAGMYQHRWDDKQRPGEVWRLLGRRDAPGRRFAATGRTVHAVPAAAVLAAHHDTAPTDTCRTVDVDGTPVRVRGARELTTKERGYVGEIVRAAQRLHDAESTAKAYRQAADRFERECPDATGVMDLCMCHAAGPLRAWADELAADRPPKPVLAYGGKGRVFCHACPHPEAESVPFTADAVDPWELCAACGRPVIDVAEQPAERAAEPNTTPAMED